MDKENRIPVVVGVTGHRAIRAQDKASLAVAVRAELEKLRALCPSSPLVLLTSLAEGADLLCADAAEVLGISLWAALPISREDYTEEFSEAAKVRFAHHCARAEHVFAVPDTETPPASGAERSFRFRQAGLYVAAHCHVLLALWDGGEGTAAACGTAAAVGFALHGTYLPANGSIPHGGNAAVLHIFTPRGDVGEAAGAVSRLGDWDALLDSLAKTDDFNRLAAECEPGERSVLPAPVPDDSLLSRMDCVRTAAGQLSSASARRYRRVLWALALVGALFTAAFLLYDEAQAIWLILVCGALLAAAWGITRYAARSSCHRRYLEFRALAECLRVQIFLRYAGSSVQAVDLLTWTQREETAWIARALAALTAGPPAQEIHDVSVYWVAKQQQYHQAAEKRAAHRSNVSDRVVHAALILSVALYCAAVVFELLCGGEICPATLPTADAEVWRTVLKIALGLLSAVTLLIAGYYGNLSLPRTRSDHRKMKRFYAEMGEVLARFGQTDAVLCQIAREELIENGNWCSYQRDNTPDISI